MYAIWGGPLRGDRERLYTEWHGLLITRWRDVLDDFDPLIWTVRNWRTEIFAYFRAPFTNAYTEAANGLVKIANRMGRGYNFAAIRARALLAPRLAQRQHWVCEGCLRQFAYDDNRGVQDETPRGSAASARHWLTSPTNRDARLLRTVKSGP